MPVILRIHLGRFMQPNGAHIGILIILRLLGMGFSEWVFRPLPPTYIRENREFQRIERAPDCPLQNWPTHELVGTIRRRFREIAQCERMKLNFSPRELCEFRIMIADHFDSSTQAFLDLSDSIGQSEAVESKPVELKVVEKRFLL